MKRTEGFLLDPALGYFRNAGVDLMAFSDFYPEGHQSGITLLMHDCRMATNGDVRLEQTPGQWQPIPRQLERVVDPDANAIRTRLRYPDGERHLRGFNPMLYPDLTFEYEVTVQGMADHIVLHVNLDRPLPTQYGGKVCFNLELFPGALLGKSWIMDARQGVFPSQPNGPTLAMPSNAGRPLAPAKNVPANADLLMGSGSAYNPIAADDIIAEPYAAGRSFTVCPEDPLRRFTVTSTGGELKLFDGRMNHNNGWFVLSCELPCGVTEGALEWIVRPHVMPEWRRSPVVQVSQVGYHPDQPKAAVVELDPRSPLPGDALLCRITAEGEQVCCRLPGVHWGRFLRYSYMRYDFSAVREEGLYRVHSGGAQSNVFRIAGDVYDRGVWQPVLEYFLPVQMCHMRVNEKYRVWHDRCHLDDARMAPVHINHFDGYVQGPSTLTRFKPGEHVPGLNAGGWHDAGDYDLRVESQAGECYILALTYETFHVDYDATLIDQQQQLVEIHQPDGRNDILQQIEHGLLSVVGGYQALGRLYRGIICPQLRQYVLLGDAAAMTDGHPGNGDDRWVFTEDNPRRELSTAAQLAASARALRGFNDELSRSALAAAEALYEITDAADARSEKLHAAAELLLTTGGEKYRAHLLQERDYIAANIRRLGWIAVRVIPAVQDGAFAAALAAPLEALSRTLRELSAETPYGIPYRPHIWGAGWGIQHLGFEYYFLHRAFPELFPPELLYHALDFILGCHPGKNTASFASGVGAKSATVAYGTNRGDWSFIPGGVISGTALIRPDFPELLEFPFLWQQTEYVLGGGSSHFMFLTLAVRQLLAGGKA